MPRAVWTGSISFGLVMIPVRLYPATNPQDVRFHELTATGRRVRHQRVVEEAGHVERSDATVDGFDGSFPEGPPDDWAEAARRADVRHDEAPETSEETMDAEAPRPSRRPVPYEDIVKGYEVEPGSYVTVSREELEALRPERSRTVEIEEFVDLPDIDPVYFEKSYWLVPHSDGIAERPYALLARAMERAGKVGIGRIVLRTKEHLAAIRPTQGVLMLETLFYADEVRDPRSLGWPLGDATMGERETRVAEQLIELLAAEWDPARHVDRYRERVRELLEAKAAGRRLTVREPEPETPPILDLMASLKASVEAAKRRTAEDPASSTG